MIPKTVPGGLQRLQNAVQKAMLDWSSNFIFCLRFLKPKWTRKRAPKSLDDENFRDLGAPAPPEASRKPPGSHFGAFLDYFWSHFDAKIAPQTSTSIQNHFLASLPFPPAAIFEPPDLIFSYFRTSGAHFQAPWPVWGAAQWIRPRSPCGSRGAVSEAT